VVLILQEAAYADQERGRLILLMRRTCQRYVEGFL